MDLKQQYTQRHLEFLTPASQKLEQFLKGCVSECARIDRVTTRPKSVERFLVKAVKEQNAKKKYPDPLTEIQDQIGARVVTYYLSDVPAVAAAVTKYLRAVEGRKIIPESASEFGYEGQHFVFLLPSDVTAGLSSTAGAPEFFELQIKTLFQHAWAEAEHDLGYKPSKPLSPLQRRQMAFTAAQAWGADQIFDELHKDLSR